MFIGILLINISNEISKRNPRKKPQKTPKNSDLYNFLSWNSIKRKPITSFKHNNTMFKGILLINISNEISKRKDEYPVPLISGTGHRSEGGVKGRLRRPSVEC